MKPKVARETLLEQHEQLRVLLGTVEDLARKLDRGAAARKTFGLALDALRIALAEHNATEEKLLEPMLRGGDVYAPLRVKRMFDEHAAEHAALSAALDGEDLDAIAQAIGDFAEMLRAHMEAEERTFLHPRVLT